MQSLLYIPWFRLEAWHIPLPLLEKVPIQPFGLLVALGVILGARLAEWRAQKNGLPLSVVSDAVAYTVLTGFIFGHVFDALFYFPEKVLEDPFFLIKIWDGLSSFGGFFGAIIGAFIWKWRRKGSIVVATDHIAFGFPLGFTFGRLGCFVVHDHPGLITTFPLAVADYHVGRPPYSPRHDLGLYEAMWAAATMLLFFYLNTKPRRPGFFLALLPILYTPIRFFLDYLRETPEGGGDVRYFGLTPGQYSALALGAIGVSLMTWIYTRPPLVSGFDQAQPSSPPASTSSAPKSKNKRKRK